MFKRIKNAWRLRNSDVLDVRGLTAREIEEKVNKSSANKIALDFGDNMVVRINNDPIGDGDTVFFGEPTAEEELEFKRDEEGTKSWYDRLKKLV